MRRAEPGQITNLQQEGRKEGNNTLLFARQTTSQQRRKELIFFCLLLSWGVGRFLVMCHATRRREHLLRLLVCVVPLLYAPVLIHSKSPTGGPGIVEPVQDSEPPRPSPKPPSSSEPNGALQATEIPDSDRGRRPLVTASMLYDTVDLLSTVYFMFFAAHVMRILALLRVLASPIIAPCRAILSIICWLLFGSEKEMMRLFGEMLHQALVALQIALAHAREPLMLATVWIIDAQSSNPDLLTFWFSNVGPL